LQPHGWGRVTRLGEQRLSVKDHAIDKSGKEHDMDDAFDPAQHKRYETRWFEDFAVGEKFILPSRTMTDAIFLAFQAASGDNHPIHYDIEFCRARGMPHMLAHGYQILIQTAAGAGTFPFMTEDSLIGFLDQSSKFLAPVYVGDTLYGTLVIDEVKPGRTTGVVGMRTTVHNQNRKLVLEGTQRYLLRKRPAPTVA
jgi:acyl dehydratase